MLLFLDTEFTGLGQRNPDLISIGLVSEDGRHSFYSELVSESYAARVSDWTKEHVLPLLEDGDCVRTVEALRQDLSDWIGALGSVRVVTDAPDYDFALLRSLLNPWPANIAMLPIWFDTYALGSIHQELLEIQFNLYFSAAKPQHHALNDAKALRRAWHQAKSLDAFQVFAGRLGL